MILIIAEKPSVMKNIIDANLEGYKPKMYKGYAMGKNFIYTHCIGHLLTLKMPKDINPIYRKWDINTLPFRFDDIPLEVNKSVEDQYKIVEGLCKRGDIEEIVNACDSDREGDLIFRNLYRYTASHIKCVSRMWIESQTPDGILESYNNRLPEKDYNNVYFAGKSRSYADYIIGLNSTMAMTNKFAQGDEVLTIGRVQTPTLRIIVDLEREILGFVSKPYYKITAKGIVNDEEIEAGYINKDLDNNRFDKKEEAEHLIDSVGVGDAVVIEAETTKRNEKPKMLYSLSDLQIDMDKRYGLTPIEVLNTVQALYETHKMVTYPRTDENHISRELSNKTYSILNSLIVNNDIKQMIFDNKYHINPIMVAKKDIGAHEALTPTGIRVTEEMMKKLNPTELKVYMAIVERFMAAFLPDAILEKQKIIFERNGAQFQSEFEMCTSLGHRAAYKYGKKDKEKSGAFISVKKGDIVNIIELKLVEGKTTPPARFSEGSLVKMMRNPIKYVTDKSDKDVLKKVEGIGTEATRANIIVELKKRGLIETDKKKNIIPTKKGMNLIDIIPSEIIKSVSLTAMFERKLDLISKGEYNHKDFLEEINKMELDFINELKAIDLNRLRMKEHSLCVCPICSGFIMERENGYFCTTDGCRVGIFKTARGAKNITPSQAISLFTTGNSKTKVLCTSKNTNKDFEALMTYKYDINEQYPNILEFDFNSDAPSDIESASLKEKVKAICKCPICKSDIIESPKTYFCSNKECKVMIFKTARGAKNITKKACKELLTKGITSTRIKCVLKDEREIEAYLSYKYNEGSEYPNQIEFVFEKDE